MNTRRMNNPPPVPSLEELKTWATPRLLRYYKTHRNSVRCPRDWDVDDDAIAAYDAHEARMSAIRHILNSREHVTT